MPTIWIVTSADSTLSHVFREADWEITFSTALFENQPHLQNPDVMMYDIGDGSLLDQFKSFCQVGIAPVLALTSNWDIAWQAIEAGADDVMIRPPDPSEMLFRAHLLVKKTGVVRVDRLAIDLAAQRVKRDGSLIKLSPIEFRLLACLAKHVGRVVSYDQILDAVWGCDSNDGGTLEQVKSAIKRLRRKIEQGSGQPQYIVCVTGMGYRLRSQTQWEEIAGSFRMSQ